MLMAHLTVQGLPKACVGLMMEMDVFIYAKYVCEIEGALLSCSVFDLVQMYTQLISFEELEEENGLTFLLKHSHSTIEFYLIIFLDQLCEIETLL